MPRSEPSGRPREDGSSDSLALTLTSVFNSVAGLLGFLIAAWVMPQEEVGRATEFVSAMQLIGGAAQLNLGIGIMRWLPGRVGSPYGWCSAACC